jgi:hypothetical protein
VNNIDDIRAQLEQAQRERDILREMLEEWRDPHNFIRQRFDHTGFMNATQLGERDWYLSLCAKTDAALAAHQPAEGGEGS